MKTVQSIDNNEISQFNDWVNVELSDGRVVGDHLDNLPLSEDQKDVIRQLQGKDVRVSRYVLMNASDGKLLLEVKTVKVLKGYSIDILNADLYTPDGKLYEDYRTNSGGYLSPRVGSTPLHELVLFEYLYRTNKKLYDDVKLNRGDYEIHHLNPWKKSRKEGNTIYNLRLLPKSLHRRYTFIVNEMERSYSNGDWKPSQWWTSIQRSKPNKKLLK